MNKIVDVQGPTAKAQGLMVNSPMPAEAPIQAFAETGDIRTLLADKAFVAALEKLGQLLHDRYTKKDSKARLELNKSILTMYANYDNKFDGLVSEGLEWSDDAVGVNDYNFSIPLFKAHIDTALTFYAKTKPRYPVKSRRLSYRYTQLANMCKTILEREYDRLMTYSVIQKEGQYAMLAGKALRHLTRELDDKSKQHHLEREVSTRLTGWEVSCTNCGYEFFMPDTEYDMVCPRCLTPNPQKNQEVFESEKQRVSYRTPRVQLHIVNPVDVQTDFAPGDSTFRVKRTSVDRHKATFTYKRDFGGYKSLSAEAQAMDKFSKEPLTKGLDFYNITDISALQEMLTQVFNLEGEKLPVVEMWLDPCEYGLAKIKGHFLYEYFPDGLYLKFVNGLLVETKSSKDSVEWVEIIAGLRPASNQGTGLMHLANLNDLINNAINLEYSVLRASGFPITIIREKYLQGILPEANNAIMLKDVPDDVSNEQIVSRLSGTSASGMLGVMSQRFEQYMQYIGATWSFSSASSDMRQMMGTATGAAAIQEMMTDRLGLILQMRIEADIKMLYNILLMMQEDHSPELDAELKEEFDSDIVDLFFEADLCHCLQIEAEKGSDQPALESLNVYKMQTFAQLTASLTGLREFDPSSFYDLVGAIGDSLNLPVEIGAGRKERHYANVQISKIETMYRDLIKQVPTAGVQPDAIAKQIFDSVKQEEQIMLSIVPGIEATLFDHKALAEVYSDWIQSRSGIDAALPVKLAVVMMFGYHQMILDQMAQAQKAEQMAMMAAQNGTLPPQPVNEGGGGGEAPSNGPPESESGIPDNIKADGTTGPGRPKEVDSPAEVASTLSGQEPQSPVEAGLGVM